MRIDPLTCHIGAELLDVQLRDAIHDDALFQAIEAALLKHRVVFLRQQQLTQKEHVLFASRFGPLEGHPLLPSPPDAPGLVQFFKTADKPADPYENTWHHDNTWRAQPSKCCVLRCLERPAFGGDTMWANMVMAYERLPEDVKTLVADLRASHSLTHYVASGASMKRRAQMQADNPPVEHPVVRIHPQTGEKLLFLGAWATHFTNFHTKGRVRFGQDYHQMGGDLFQYLMSQASIPEYQVRWRWQPDSVAIWDNCSTQHYAVMDYPPSVRKMERASVVGVATG